MACQCATTGDAPGADAAYGGCECGMGADAEAGCGCGSAPAPTPTSLERLVMELDKRVRRLEAERDPG